MARVRVPQTDGEIRISDAGDPANVYPVSAGTVEVPEAKVPMFLRVVDGSERLDDPPPPLPSPDELASMTASDLVALLQQRPDAVAEVETAELQRPDGARATVTKAIEAARAAQGG